MAVIIGLLIENIYSRKAFKNIHSQNAKVLKHKSYNKQVVKNN